MVHWVEHKTPLRAKDFTWVKLEFSGNTFMISYQKEPIQLISPIWLVLKSLYDMLTEDQISRIKEYPACGWVFLDETRNGKRRWCRKYY